MGCNCGKSSFNTVSTQSFSAPSSNSPAVGVPIAPPAPTQTAGNPAPLSGIQAPRASGDAFVR